MYDRLIDGDNLKDDDLNQVKTNAATTITKILVTEVDKMVSSLSISALLDDILSNTQLHVSTEFD